MKTLVIGLIALTAFNSFAKEGGNGGGAFVCRDSKGKIISAELVDFYEGTSEYKLLIKKSSAEIEDQINKASLKFVSALPSKTQTFLESVQNVQNLMNVVPNARLENTNDFNLRVAPKTCAGGVIKFEQLANYTDDNRLTVDEEIYSALSNTDKAGLVIHEAAYLLARNWHDAISSREARRLTAHLFSNTPAKSISKEVLEMNLIDPNSNKKWMCSALIIGVEYKEEGSYYIKKDIYKKNISSTGSDIFKASKNLEDMINSTNPFPIQLPNYRAYAKSWCGADSSTNILEKISTWDFKFSSINTIIDCQRTWSPNFDCKEI